MSKFILFRSAILAGIAIGIAGFGFLILKGVLGAIFFSFGLITVIRYKMKLYTGVIGFVQSWSDVKDTFIVLAGNLVGVLSVALLARLSPLGLQESAQSILEGRLATGAPQCGALAIGCGFIITVAVTFARQEKWLPLLFGVPLFIICGFPHCIADAFYYLTVPVSFLAKNVTSIIPLYLFLIAGNFLGCNLYRLIMWEK